MGFAFRERLNVSGFRETLWPREVPDQARDGGSIWPVHMAPI